DSAFALLRGHPLLITLQLGANKRICLQYPKSKRAQAALQQLESTVSGSGFEQISPLFLASQAWRVREDREAVRRWMNLVEPAKTPKDLALTSNFHLFQDRLLHSRLSSLLGNVDQPTESTPLPEDEEQRIAIFVDRAVTQVGVLW